MKNYKKLPYCRNVFNRKWTNRSRSLEKESLPSRQTSKRETPHIPRVLHS